MGNSFREIVRGPNDRVDEVPRLTTPLEVVILTYNSSRWIEACMRSVLNQETDVDFTITVHDDASTDDTCSLIRKLGQKANVPVTLIRREKNALSIGGEFYFELLMHSNSEFVAILDGDDFWLSRDKIQRQYLAIKDSDSAISYHDYVSFRRLEDSKLRVFPSNLGVWAKDYFYTMAAENPIGTSTVMLRTDSLTSLDMSDSGKHPFLDFPIWAQLAAKSKPQYLSGIKTAYRIHPGGISRDKTWHQSLREGRVVNRWLATRVSSLGKSKILWTIFSSLPVRVLWITLSSALRRFEITDLRPEFLANPHK